MTCKGEITAKDNRKYGGIWQKDDDCVITCVRRIIEKERNRQEAILEANVGSKHQGFHTSAQITCLKGNRPRPPHEVKVTKETSTGIKRSCSSEPGNNKKSGEAFNTKNRHSKDNKTKPPEQGRSGKRKP
ncbi:hypothetical protein pdam_00013292 [Pocillopora damicornis]|uniref:Uncharacterized protein n=1 Tax=Pocillopora damicornis TaxID=46731 RepID=A0A3M6UIQ2_POCDA|nr:hypothetical protein pdam_00013292 [Pocillopora damicornis]